MTTYSSNKERTNYSILCRAIIDLCSAVLRDVLSQQIHPINLEKSLRSCTDLRSAGFKNEQWKIIKRGVATGSYREFDISLLYQVLRLLGVQELRDTIKLQIPPNKVNTDVQNCPALVSIPGTKLGQDELNDVKYVASINSYDHCKDRLLWKLYNHICPKSNPNLTHPSKPWGDNPDPSNVTTGDDVERIRIMRNTLYGHISTTEISDNDFNTHWSDLEDIMTRMNLFLPGGHYREDLDAIKNMCMDDVLDKWYHDEIEKSSIAENTLQSQINEFRATIDNNIEQAKTILQGEIDLQVKKFKGDIDAIKSQSELERKALKESVVGINNDIGTVTQSTRDFIADYKTDITDVTSRIETVERVTNESIAECVYDIKKCSSEIKTLKQRTKESSATVKDITTRITRVEEVVDQMETDKKASNAREISAVEEQTLAMISKHREDKTFVSTKAVEKGMDMLRDHGVLIYSGLPGDGKTENSHELLQRYHLLHPDWSFLEYDDVINWLDVHPNFPSLILLDDCLGRTNTNSGLLIYQKYWNKIYACVKTAKVKVIMTIRKNILVKNMTQLERYELFSEKHIVDLTSDEFRLDEKEKKEILMNYFKKNDIIICDGYEVENFRSCSVLDGKTPVKISQWTVNDIVRTNPVIGYPLSCYLFCSNRKYTKLGLEYFRKPSQLLIDEIENFINSESRLEKIQYCVMAYMMLMGGKIYVDNMDSCLFQQVVESLSIDVPSNREINQAMKQLYHRYVEQIDKHFTYQFKHQTILESVAMCFYQENASLLLKLCSKSFVTEFVRLQGYKVSEGEIVLLLKQSDYKKLMERFTVSQHDNVELDDMDSIRSQDQ